MIYDFTDNIFRWNGWRVIKWITGTIIISGIIYLLWNQNNNIDYNVLIEHFLNKILQH